MVRLARMVRQFRLLVFLTALLCTLIVIHVNITSIYYFHYYYYVNNIVQPSFLFFVIAVKME